MSLKVLRFVILSSMLLVLPAAVGAAQTLIPLRLLYPSFAGSWGTAWIAKEAGYFANEGLDVELIRVGGSTRMVAALLGGSAPIIQAGASAALAAVAKVIAAPRAVRTASKAPRAFFMTLSPVVLSAPGRPERAPEG